MMNNIKRFFEPIFDDKIIYIRGMIIYFIRGVDRVIHVLFLERIVFYLENFQKNNFLLILYIYISYIIGYIIFSFLSRKYGRTEISDTCIKYLQKRYIDKFLILNNNYTENFGTGKLVAIIHKGIDIWGRLLDSLLNNGINILVGFGFTLYMLGKSNLLFLGIFILIYIIFYICSYFLNLGALKYRRHRRDWGNSHTNNFVRCIMTKQETLYSNKIGNEIKVLDKCKNKEIFYNKKMSNYLTPMFEAPNVAIALLIVSILYILGIKYLSGDITLSGIVGIVSALVLMQSAIEKGILFFKDFTKDFTDVEKLWDFFDNAPQIQGYEEGKDFIHKNGNIEIKKLKFGYNQDKQIFSDFSLKIQEKKVLALVGDSGSGKSTLVKMIAGYMRPNSGEIIVDEQKLSETSLKSYYKDIGYLTQDPSVFDGSILDNLTYALEEKVSEEKIKEIISLAKCEFIYELPKGLETQIGERGVKLSGGQKQRLAIAKIFLKNPKIIILDEPTSALDSFSEEKITKAMQNLFENRTVIVIAHRLQTVKHADRILVLENGEIIEDGKHDELVEKNGKYAKMLELQSGF